LTVSNSEPIVLPSPTVSPNVKFANPNGQAASLGRNGTPTLEAQRELALRRNSLGDLKTTEGGLKIPARISRVQVNLKRDLILVKEFATCVDGESVVFPFTTYAT
jgi:serine/arginine repetitive matrix protein 2